MKNILILILLSISSIGFSQDLQIATFPQPELDGQIIKTLLLTEKYDINLRKISNNYNICYNNLDKSTEECYEMPPLNDELKVKKSVSIIDVYDSFSENEFEFILGVIESKEIQFYITKYNNTTKKYSNTKRIGNHKLNFNLIISQDNFVFDYNYDKTSGLQTVTAIDIENVKYSENKRYLLLATMYITVLDDNFNQIDNFKVNANFYSKTYITKEGNILIGANDPNEVKLYKYITSEKKLVTNRAKLEEIGRLPNFIFDKAYRVPHYIERDPGEEGFMFFFKENKSYNARFFHWDKENNLLETKVKFSEAFFEMEFNHHMINFSSHFIESDNKNICQFFFRQQTEYSKKLKTDLFPFKRHALCYALFDGEVLDVIEVVDLSEYYSKKMNLANIELSDQILLIADNYNSTKKLKNKIKIKSYNLKDKTLSDLNINLVKPTPYKNDFLLNNLEIYSIESNKQNNLILIRRKVGYKVEEESVIIIKANSLEEKVFKM